MVERIEHLNRSYPPGLPTTFRPPSSKFATVEDLVPVVQEALEDLQLEVDDIFSILFDKPSIEDITSSDLIPPISPREILYWCLLNTTGFREELKTAYTGGSTTLEPFIRQFTRISSNLFVLLTC